MKTPKLTLIGCLLALACGSFLNASAQPKRLAEGTPSPTVTSYITPTRVVWTSDPDGCNVRQSENLLIEHAGQVSTTPTRVCVLSNRDGGEAGILLDFGKEYQGALEIGTAIRVGDERPIRVRVRFGESVSEAMSDIGGPGGATNDHAMRDFIIELPWLGLARTNESGFRFARIDLVDPDTELPLEFVRTVFRYRDIPYLGSFASSDERLNRIWDTGAYTVHLNMQDYLWEGIKRDRLIWVGDLHPEIMCLSTVFGENDVVNRSLDLARELTPLPGWMNGMCSYSLWWIIIHRDLYLHNGDLAYLREQHGYLKELVRQVIRDTDGNREKLSNGTRFLDWPTSEMPDVIHSGLQALTVMALEAAGEIAAWTGDRDLQKQCEKTAKKLRTYTPEDHNNKQAAALLALSGLEKPEAAARVLARDGADRFSTFYGYYMLEALALNGEYETACKIISDYWGGMLDLGATTFWEGYEYSDLARASRIDEPVPAGAFDIHADAGIYCYVGLRNSLCHGWAAGPTPWMTRHILGIRPLEPGCAVVEVKPNLAHLQWAEGTFPTPYGVLSVRHEKQADGTVKTDIQAPDGVTIRR